MTQKPKCPICATGMNFAFEREVLGKYAAKYFLCSECGLLHTPEAFWLEEAYSSAISTLDTWGASRNYFNSRRVAPVLHRLVGSGEPVVDVGCGYGLLVRLLRDQGFTCYGQDEYCQNLFARGFSPPAGIKASVLMAFEVLEHLLLPREFIERELAKYGSASFLGSTTVWEGDIPDFSWQYYGFETGQHVSLFQPRTFRCLAKQIGAEYIQIEADLHLLTREPLSETTRWLIRQRRINRLLWRFAKRRYRSLTVPDFEELRKHVASN
jgi:hypothetical protein